MARRTAIDQFAEKLRLALGRANLSRTALAQRVGVDKSVVARWSSGALHPADHSLAALSAALAQAIPGFDATAWDLALPDFAARLGIAAAPRPAGTAQPDSVMDFALGASEGRIEEAAATYAGIWLMLYPAMGRPARLVGYGARLHRPPGQPALSFGFSNGGLIDARGQAFAMLSRLYCLFRPAHLAHMIGALIFDGAHDDRAEVLDGIMLSKAAGVDPVIGAGRVIWLRLTDAVDNAAYAATAARADALQGEWDGLVTPALRTAFRPPPPDPGDALDTYRQTRVAPAESWAITERNLRLRPNAPQRSALDALRAPFRGVVPGILP